jgi:hypothetical protein
MKTQGQSLNSNLLVKPFASFHDGLRQDDIVKYE